MAKKLPTLHKVVQESSQKIKEYGQGIYDLLDVNQHKFGQSTRVKILRSSLSLIAQKYTTDISIREIARHANINIALVNYHFHSKNSMLEELFSHVIQGFDRLFFLLDSQTLSAENCLIRWADRFVRYLLLYPGALIIMQDSPKWKNITKQAEEALERLQKRLDPLLRKLCEENGEARYIEDEELGLRRSILLNSLLQPIYSLNSAFDLRSRLRIEHLRKIYIVQVIHQQKFKLNDTKFENRLF